MKKLFTLLYTLWLATTAQAQVFPIDTVAYTGPSARRINLVFLSDGYQAAELNRFPDDVQRIVDAMFRQAPFSQYRPYFNVFALRVPSAESGATHHGGLIDCGTQPTGAVNNYFGSHFDEGGIHRLLFPANQSALASVLADNFPQYDQAFVLVNSEHYGGSGGALATSSTHYSAGEISIHEIGHSFAQLADEYWAGLQYAAERANMTTESKPTRIKWTNWLNSNGVGIYPYPENPAWFKPHPNCKMQTLGQPFCSVCAEAFVERIHTLAPPIQSYAPAAGTIPTPPPMLALSVDLLAPQPNTLQVLWKRNGTVFARNTSQVQVPLGTLPTGPQRFTVEVTDTTALTRSDSHRTQHGYVLAWEVQNTITGTRVGTAAYEYQLSVYPNPVLENLNLSYKLSSPAPVTLAVYSPDGRKLKTLTQGRQAAGQYQYSLTPTELSMRRSGTYLLVLDINGNRITRQLIKE